MSVPDFSGVGYLAGEAPDGLTTVVAVPVTATVQVLWRDPETDEEHLVASTTSAPDGTWRITDLNHELEYVVRGIKDGWNDVTVVGAVPTRMDLVTATGTLETNEDGNGVAGSMLIEGGLPPYTVSVIDPLPYGLTPVLDHRTLTVEGVSSDNGIWQSTLRVTASNAVTLDIPIEINIEEPLASGGIESLITVGDVKYRLLRFDESGDLTVRRDGYLDLLVVGGGGGGGRWNCGGGGGGGQVRRETIAVTAGVYPVVVGQGGAADTTQNSSTPTNTNGGSSTVLGLTALGGGAGGKGGNDGVDAAARAGKTGASGGGGGSGYRSGAGGAAGSALTGFPGGAGAFDATAATRRAAGGGGAGGPGGNWNSPQNGFGGVGAVDSITGAAELYGGGGAGGANSNTYRAYGGLGGGGNGACPAADAGDGVDGTGGGGGGGCEGSPTATAGRGGHGVVYVRFALA